mmetsp:Transcript_114615/g.365494  ORF Transcript_114615/g.365494 Transcript_114615/m.365494 type:complete len:202 (-) Transcript_114615:8-613(-)
MSARMSSGSSSDTYSPVAGSQVMIFLGSSAALGSGGRSGAAAALGSDGRSGDAAALAAGAALTKGDCIRLGAGTDALAVEPRKAPGALAARFQSGTPSPAGSASWAPSASSSVAVGVPNSASEVSLKDTRLPTSKPASSCLETATSRPASSHRSVPMPSCLLKDFTTAEWRAPNATWGHAERGRWLMAAPGRPAWVLRRAS